MKVIKDIHKATSELSILLSEGTIIPAFMMYIPMFIALLVGVIFSKKVQEDKMPAICDVCGEEVSYEEKIFKLRNGAEIVICKKCIKRK